MILFSVIDRGDGGRADGGRADGGRADLESLTDIKFPSKHQDRYTTRSVTFGSRGNANARGLKSES